jgi:anthranilate 1,2-dioxygenase small subunit/terephthalate 1,2-dioxygenase oxygenase component beta subunit
MREGTMDVFATGCYRDKVKPDASGALRFAERIVVCDGRRFGHPGSPSRSRGTEAPSL